MPTIIRVASQAFELNDVLEVRYQALEQAGRKVSHIFLVTKKIIDHFDVFPSTVNIIAYSAGHSVGSIRAVEYVGDVHLLNHTFDFTEASQNLKGKIYLLDMLVIVKEFAGHTVFYKQLIRTALSILARRGTQFVFFNCPSLFESHCKELGFSAVAESVSARQSVFVPMVVEVQSFYRKFIEGIADQEIIRFQDVFYKAVFEPGEIIVVEGERGSTAYLIEEGEIEVLLRKGDQFIPINTITKGNLIGEVAMVTNEPRTASLIAKTTTSCLAFDRDEFMRFMYAHPQRSLDVFKIFSKRLTETNQKLAQAKG